MPLGFLPEVVVPGKAALTAATVVAVLLSLTASVAADTEYAVRGLVVGVDPARKSMTVSHERIPGFMDAMTMPFEVNEASELRGVVPGAIVEFTLIVGARRAHATRISVRQYESVERDPRAASRLAVMKKLAGMSTPPVAVGTKVPDFTLIDHARRPVTLSSLAGKV